MVFLVHNLSTFVSLQNFRSTQIRGFEFQISKSFLKKIQPKIYKQDIFWAQIQAFLLFHDILQLDKFQGADFKYDNILFTFQPKNTQLKHFLAQISVFLGFLCKILQLNKLEGADFKYDNIALTLRPKNIQISIFGPKFRHCCFFEKYLQLNEFEGADFKYDNIVFKWQRKNTQIRHFSSQIQVFSLFHDIFQLSKFEGADFKYDNIVFKCSPKIPK